MLHHESIKKSLSFCLELLPTWEGYDKYNGKPSDADKTLELMNQEAAFIQGLYKSRGLMASSRVWTQIELTPDTAKMLHEWILSLEADGLATLGSGYYFEEDVSKPCEEDWFVIESDGFMHEELNSHRLYPSCNSYKLPCSEGLIVGSFVSSIFKDVAEKNKLKGLEFLWIKDTGKYLAPHHWYMALVKQCMGHGVDHPWYDSLKGEKTKNLSAIERHGINYAFSDRIKSDWSTGDYFIDRILRKLPAAAPLGFRFESMYRFQKKYIPKDTDFAYFWYSQDSFKEDGVPLRHRPLCVSARAREVLIQNKVLKPERFKKVLILDELTEGQVDLDTGHPVLPPIRTPEEWNELKKMEAVYWAEYQAKPKLPKKPATLKQVLKLLRERKKDDEGDFTKGTRKTDLPEPCPPLPDAWAKVLAVSNGFEVYDTENSVCRVRSVQDLPTMQEEYGKEIELEDQLTCHDLFFIATNECGDIYAFLYDDLSNPLKDCPVVRIDHEVMHIDHTWPTIPEFLEAVMTQ